MRKLADGKLSETALVKRNFPHDFLALPRFLLDDILELASQKKKWCAQPHLG